MADAHKLSERMIDMARRFEDVVDAAEGKGNRGGGGIGTKWLLLPAAFGRLSTVALPGRRFSTVRVPIQSAL